jgi:GTP-binding protein
MQPAELTSEQLDAGEALAARPWQFVKSAPALQFLPEADRPEIAFAGRSNVGKSSLINALVRRRGLARASNTPGRTQELNYFETPGVELYLVDMPGYGFAEAPKAKVEAWTRLVKAYLRGRPTLLRVYLLIDARHGLKRVDLDLMELMDEAAVSYQAVLTKADKVKPQHLAEIVAETHAELSKHPAAFARLVATSAQAGAGIPELRAEIAVLAAVHGAFNGGQTSRPSGSRNTPRPVRRV